MNNSRTEARPFNTVEDATNYLMREDGKGFEYLSTQIMSVSSKFGEDGNRGAPCLAKEQ